MIKLLFLDDLEERCTALRARLGKHEKKFQIEHTETAEECIELLQEHTYDLIMLDYNLRVTRKMNQSINAMPVAEYLTESMRRHKDATIILHSNCPNAAAEMAYLMSKNPSLEVWMIPSAYDYITYKKGLIGFEIIPKPAVPAFTGRSYIGIAHPVGPEEPTEAICDHGPFNVFTRPARSKAKSSPRDIVKSKSEAHSRFRNNFGHYPAFGEDLD